MHEEPTSRSASETRTRRGRHLGGDQKVVGAPQTSHLVTILLDAQNPMFQIPRYFRMMVVGQRRKRGSLPAEQYRKGLPGYHDPTAGIGGAAPAYSALTLRLVLATFGLVSCTALAIGLFVIRAPIAFVVVSVILAATAAIDIAVVVRRKRRGEPG